MLFADNVGVDLQSVEGFAKKITVIVVVFEAAGLTVTETMFLQTPDQTTLTPPLAIKAVGQRCKQTAQLSYLGSIAAKTLTSLEIDRQIRLIRACLERFGLELYDRTTAPLSGKGSLGCCRLRFSTSSQ